MALESNLQRRRLSTTNDTFRDDMNANEESNPLNNIIPVLAASAGIFAMYKKGMFKEVIKSGMEIFEKTVHGNIDRAYLNLDTIKDWSKLESLAPDKLKDLGYRIPENSIFRGSNLSKLKELGLSTASEIQKGDIRMGYARRIINDTLEDINQLKFMMQEKESLEQARKFRYHNSDLIVAMKDLKKFSREVEANTSEFGSQILINSRAAQELVHANTLSFERESELLKLNGYRPIMLQDIMDRPDLVEGVGYVYKGLENAKISLEDNIGEQVYNTAQELLSVMGNSTFRYQNARGEITNMIGDWDTTKRLILDKNILMNDNGEIIDLRTTGEIKSWLKRSVTTDFKIPGLNFNPLTSLFPDWATDGYNKTNFGILSEGSIQPFITGKAGRETLGENLYVMHGKAFRVNGESLELVTEGVTLNDITKAGQYGFNKRIDTLRKQAGLEYYTHDLKENVEEAIEAGGVKGKPLGLLDRFMSWLDMGKPDNYVHRAVFNPDGERVDPKKHLGLPDADGWLTDRIYNVAQKFNIYEAKSNDYTPENLFGGGPINITKNGETEYSRKFIATLKGRTLRGVTEQEGIMGKIDYTREYLKEAFLGGRKKDNTFSEYTTETTLGLYGLFDNVLGRLNSIAPQLGFSTDSKGNLPQYLLNFAAKRVLPIYAVTQAPEMLNALSEPIFNLFNSDKDGTDNRNNITKFTMNNVVKPIDLGMHRVKDILGITKLMDKIEEFTPGFDQINELPGIYNLGLTQSYDERREYIENGYDPVRKSRYWGLGNTPYTGGKIMYWRPNLYRRVEADVDFSDSKWGSRQEYYSNTWYPNLVNPLAPINHFILDRNHYDRKHYYDRPYLLTSNGANNVPVIGPLLSAFTPQTRMHKEYWEGGQPVEKDDETVPIVDYVNYNSTYQRQQVTNNAFINSLILQDVNNTYAASQSKDGYARALSAKQARAVTQYDYSGPQQVMVGNILPDRTDNTFSTFMTNISDLEVYTTPSGNMSVVDIPTSLNLWTANQRLREYSIKRFHEADTRVDVNDPNRFAPQLADYANEKINNSFVYNMGEQFNTVSDFFGMRGFETQAFITGKANKDARVIEDSNYAYSFNKEFWDQNLGGFGGDASEIFRRFVQKRNTDTEYVNPIRNTMPSWMPGRDYFTDFKHGDPYSKVDNGEERLPGEGYERLYGINSKQMFELGIGSSYIGKAKEDIQKHLLNQDSIDSFGMEVTEKGNRIHAQVEKAWEEAGLAINTEVQFKDNINNILGFYDAMIHDPTSKTGKAIVDIKSVGEEKFYRIMQQGHADFENQSQVNYYLWATGNKRSNGYIYYINRDNPDQTYTAGFKFSQDLLEQNLNTLHQARNEIYQGIENGTIGRGELYSTIDRYRILADVAPYSEEFQSVKARLANDPNLTPEEQAEISQINERLQQQKEPLRVYPYKFKTSNLQSERVRVKKVIDNNTILVNRYGTDHAIKLAGIRVSESNSEMYNKRTTMNDAAAKELRKHIRRGKSITIAYDADDANKYGADSTKSIQAVVYSDGRNVNQTMLNKGLAKEKEDDGPAAIHAKYTKNEIAVGSAMERITHAIGQVPFIGNKFFQVKSPYEQYRDREVYGKDFQSWNNPIKDYLGPEMIDKVIRHGNAGPEGIIAATALGGFLGSLFGNSKYGKLTTGFIGGAIGLIGSSYTYTQKDSNRDWIPERREKQAELNEYFDTLKYVKNMRLYEKYRHKALKEDRINIDSMVNEKQIQGIYNKNRVKELEAFKKTVKLDYKHRKQFDFKYGAPEGLDINADSKSIIRTVNQELKRIQSDREIQRLPENVIRAITYKQQAEQTMYGYKPGDPLNNFMKALPKKERQYFKHFVDAPEEEKDEILRIAPDYLRRGLQQAWGMKVDEKPTLQEYFQTHGLPDSNWIGWDENVDLENVKVKLVHNNKLDMGEFDLWDDQIEAANQVNIPVPKIHSQNSRGVVQLKLQAILGRKGYQDVTVMAYDNARGNRNTLDVYQDSRDEIESAIYNLNY